MAQKDDAKPSDKKGSGFTKMLFMLIGILILVGGSVGATLFLTGALHKGATGEESGHAAAAPSPAAAGHGEPSGHGAPAPAAPMGGARLPAVYQSIDPPFIINFEDQGVLRYLQIGLAVMTRDKGVVDAVTNNLPQIRNNLIMLFANQKLETLQTNEGKEKLRAQALEQIQAVLSREIGYAGIEAVYFTIFVMQ